MRNRNGVDLDVSGDEEEQGGIERGKTIIRIYYERKKSIFNERKNYRSEKRNL